MPSQQDDRASKEYPVPGNAALLLRRAMEFIRNVRMSRSRQLVKVGGCEPDLMRNFVHLVLGAMALASASQSHAAEGCGMYPEAVYETVIASGWSDCDLKDAGEPTLWQKIPNELKQVTRFVFTEGHGSFFRFVTITEKLDGTGEMKIGGADHDKRDHATRLPHRSRQLSREQISRLNALGAQSDPWKFDVGSWDGDEIYMHCQLLEMERANADGYRYSSVSIGCSHPTKLMPLADEIVRLAGLETINGGRLYR